MFGKPNFGLNKAKERLIPPSDGSVTHTADIVKEEKSNKSSIGLNNESTGGGAGFRKLNQTSEDEKYTTEQEGEDEKYTSNNYTEDYSQN